MLDKRNTKVPLILGTTWLKSDEQILSLMDDEFEHGKTKSLLPIFLGEPLQKFSNDLFLTIYAFFGFLGT